MRTTQHIRLITIGALALVFASFAAGPALAGPKDDIEKKAREAMENYDLMEYEEAKRLLNEAIGIAKKNRIADKTVARVYLNLGIVYFSGFQDVESAKVAFINAVEIDGSVSINPAYKTGEMEQLLADAKKDFAGKGGGGDGGGGGGEPVEPVDTGGDIDCASVVGIVHTLIDTADGGKDLKVKAGIAGDLGAAKVVLHYRSKGRTDFLEIPMKKSKDCVFAGTIPAEEVSGEVVHYYIAAYNKAGKTMAKKGAAGSPNIIEVLSASGGGGGGSDAGGGEDKENPFARGGGGGNRVKSGNGNSGGGIVKGPGGPKGPGKWFVSIAAGTGGGYVTGKTEIGLESTGPQNVSCCFAPALVHVFPEIGYRMSPSSSVSLAIRMGLVIGANVAGHATAAPAGLIRYRKSLKPTGDGLEWSLAAGGGFIRYTVPLNDDMSTDTAVTGPFLVGGGLGWIKSMGGSLKFVAELNALAGVPVIGEIGGPPPVKPNFALHFDANLGVVFGF